MQNYSFNFVIQGNIWMISTFLFWKKKQIPFYNKIVKLFEGE